MMHTLHHTHTHTHTQRERERGGGEAYISHSAQRNRVLLIAASRHYQSRPECRGHGAYHLIWSCNCWNLRMYIVQTHTHTHTHTHEHTHMNNIRDNIHVQGNTVQRHLRQLFFQRKMSCIRCDSSLRHSTITYMYIHTYTHTLFVHAHTE